MRQQAASRSTLAGGPGDDRLSGGEGDDRFFGFRFGDAAEAADRDDSASDVVEVARESTPSIIRRAGETST